MGAVIGTGSYSLIDGSTVRTPGVGVFLADPKRTNMENYGVQPDMLVDNSPADNLAGSRPPARGRGRRADEAVAGTEEGNVAKQGFVILGNCSIAQDSSALHGNAPDDLWRSYSAHQAEMR